jgi:hypothetical protein
VLQVLGVVVSLMRSLLVLLVLVVLPASASAADAPCTRTWAGGDTGGWNTAANWAPAGVPGPTDVVCIPTAGTSTTVNTPLTVRAVRSERPLLLTQTLTVDDAAETSTATALTLGTADLLGTGDWAIGALTWNHGGVIAGPGTLTVTGSASVPAGSVVIGDGRTVIFQGPSVVDTDITFSGTATFVNRGAMTGTLGDSWSAPAADGGTPVLVNDTGASMTKTGGAGNANVGTGILRVLNLGTFEDSQPEVSGYLSIDNGVPTPGVPSTGVFRNIRMSGPQELGPGVVLDGVRFDSGGDTTYPYDEPLTITGGAWEGASTTFDAPITLAGTIRFWYGRITAPRVTQPAGGSINQEASVVVDAPRVEIGGTFGIEGTGCGSPVNVGRRAVWEVTGTLTLLTASCTLFNVSESPADEAARIVNRGTLVKQGTGTATVEPVLVNDGLLDIRSGTLSARRFEQTPDGTLRFGVNGATAGSGYGVLSTTALRYSGRLEAVLGGGYVPAPLARHNVLASTLANRSGLFHATSLAGLTLDESAAANIGLVAPPAAAARSAATVADTTPSAAEPPSVPPLAPAAAPLASLAVPVRTVAPGRRAKPAGKAGRKAVRTGKRARDRRARSRAARVRSRRAR